MTSKPSAEEQSEDRCEHSDHLPCRASQENAGARANSEDGEALPIRTDGVHETLPRQWPHVATRPIAAANMTLVVPQPTTLSHRPLVLPPMIRRPLPTSITSTSSAGERKPFSRPVQKVASMG